MLQAALEMNKGLGGGGFISAADMDAADYAEDLSVSRSYSQEADYNDEPTNLSRYVSTYFCPAPAGYKIPCCVMCQL